MALEAAAKLASHEIAWTDDVVKTTLKKYAELLKAGCCGTPEQMFAGDWDNAADQIFTADAPSSYLLIGMWMNARARNDYKLKEGVDYSIFQFPSLGAGHRRHLERRCQGSARSPPMAPTRRPPMPSSPTRPSKDAADILASTATPRRARMPTPSLPRPGAAGSRPLPCAQSKVQFVLGDLLPGDLVDEYRVQLQKFLQDPCDATIDAVTAGARGKAAETY